MKFRVEINCNNAAFDDENRDSELSRILGELAEKLANGEGPHPMMPTRARTPLYDINGNKVGEATFPKR